MLTFEDARQLVESAIRPDWRAEDGTLIVLPDGWEDATHWQVVAGAREYLVDGDPAFGRIDWPALLVDKKSGAVLRLPVMANFERLDRMTPVGESRPRKRRRSA
jgi:hypothetical protein